MDLKMVRVENLPEEMLLKIFSHYMETETQSEFLNNISHVCQAWEKVCMDSSLWHSFDGTLSIHCLKKLCNQGTLKNAEKFKFCYFKSSPSKEELQGIYRNLPRLKSINFSGICSKLTKDECRIFNELIDYCPNLCKIILLDKRLKNSPRIYCKSLENFLRIRGSRFVSLDFSNTAISNLKELFITIASACPKLEELRAMNIRNLDKGYFPIVCMQKRLKELKVLELGKEIMAKLEVLEAFEPTGFPNLEILTYRSERNGLFMTLSFNELLRKSPRLKLLDIRGCAGLSYDNIFCLPAKNLEELYVCNTKIYESQWFIRVLRKWGHSLVVLDVSKMKENHINSLFSSLITDGCLQNLQILYLNNTEVTISTVKTIIQNCPKLNYLDLESCEAIGGEYERIYQGEIEIQELLSLY